MSGDMCMEGTFRRMLPYDGMSGSGKSRAGIPTRGGLTGSPISEMAMSPTWLYLFSAFS